MTKVCLINPGYNMPGLKANRIPLGLAYVAGVIKSRGHEVIGYNFDVDNYDLFIKDISNYDVFGIYCSTALFKFVAKITRDIKRTNPNAKIIIGGPYPTKDPVKVLERLPVADIAAFGDGEYTFADTVDALSNNTDLGGILGIAWRAGGRVNKKNNPRPRITDLDALPFPAKEVFDHGNYKPKWFAYGAIIASRGCPFRCITCQPILNNLSKYRVRKPEKVVEEMDKLHKNHKVNHFCFEDSELLISKGWALKFADEIANKGLKITFEGNARLDQLDDDVLKKLKQAGCIKLNVGIESGSQRVLDILKKDINLKEQLPRFNKIRENGMDSHAWIIIGIPGETWDEIMETIKMAINLNATTIELNIATPWAGTEMYEYGKSKGWIVDYDPDKLDEKSLSCFKTPHLTPEDVQDAYKVFMKEFKKHGWIKWSYDANTFCRKPPLNSVLKHALGKIGRGDVRAGDFKILFSWFRSRLTFG